MQHYDTAPFEVSTMSHVCPVILKHSIIYSTQLKGEYYRLRELTPLPGNLAFAFCDMSVQCWFIRVIYTVTDYLDCTSESTSHHAVEVDITEPTSDDFDLSCTSE